MAQKRRITPQLISTTASAAPQAAFGAPHDLPPVLSPPQAGQSRAMSLKEQSEYAAKALGPGRRIYVELGPDTIDVNWHKVLVIRLPAGL